ncbi:MAG TPA: DUF6455 family protein [Burkholderiales bacterium]|jgi:hypothetical protein
MGTLVGAAVLAGVGTLGMVAGWAGYRLWRAVMLEQRSVLIHRVLERDALSLAGTGDTLQLAQGAIAIRRCVACRERETCLAWLEGDDTIAFERFCPNAGLISELRADARAAARKSG